MTKTDDTKIALVLAVHDQEEAVTQNLPRFMDAFRDMDCKVVVVDNASTDRTPEILENMKAQYAHLYTTFLPQSVRNNSRLQLALTVGVKATTSPFVILADIKRPPVSSEWIEAAADEEVVLIYSSRKTDDRTVKVQRFLLLEDASSMIRKAERRSGQGHHGQWLKMRRGLYDAIVVDRRRAYDAIKYFDLPIKSGSLIKLRLSVFWKNLFLRTE